MVEFCSDFINTEHEQILIGNELLNLKFKNRIYAISLTLLLIGQNMLMLGANKLVSISRPLFNGFN